jgi:hypothetical protein
MKNLKLIIVLLASLVSALAQSASAPIKANKNYKLIWDANPLSDSVAHYNVFIAPTNAPPGTIYFPVQVPDPNSTNALTTPFISTVTKPLVELFDSKTNGVYTVTISAVGFSALESAPSFPPLYVFWYGNTPATPPPPTAKTLP